LLELTRHSDHHYRASKKYQTLERIKESPQLPLGYPGSMVLSWFPPLWFKIMNKRLEQKNH
jgi:alkane 1-monooxygenase